MKLSLPQFIFQSGDIMHSHAGHIQLATTEAPWCCTSLVPFLNIFHLNSLLFSHPHLLILAPHSLRHQARRRKTTDWKSHSWKISFGPVLRLEEFKEHSCMYLQYFWTLSTSGTVFVAPCHYKFYMCFWCAFNSKQTRRIWSFAISFNLVKL